MYWTFDWTIFKTIIQSKLQVFRTLLIGHMVDYAIWMGTTTLVTGYLLQSFGMSRSFGPFQFAGCLATTGLFEVYGNVSRMLMDFEGDQTINYYLMLPTSAATVFMALIGYYALVGILTALFMLPLAKLLLWHYISISAISWLPLMMIILIANLFFGVFALWVTTFIKDFDHLGSLWTRFIFPIWFWGGFQFPWATMYELVPALAYLTLLDPVVYTMEGTRAALLGGATYFNAWLCIAVLSLFCVLCFADSMRRLKKRLDFV